MIDHCLRKCKIRLGAPGGTRQPLPVYGVYSRIRRHPRTREVMSPIYSRHRRASQPFRWKRRRFACRKPALPAASWLRVAKQGPVSWSRRKQTNAPKCSRNCSLFIRLPSPETGRLRETQLLECILKAPRPKTPGMAAATKSACGGFGLVEWLSGSARPVVRPRVSVQRRDFPVGR